MYTVRYLPEYYKDVEENYIQKFWYENQEKPVIEGKLAELIATGDELEQIKIQFVGIPYCKGGTCRWTGEMAAFIFENLL